MQKMNDTKNTSKHIRKGDKVIVLSGNDRGQTGSVLRIIGNKAIVQGINIRKKHVKRSEANPQGGIVEIERPIHLSNVQVCTEDNQPVKLKVRRDESGNRVLYYKTDGQDVLYRTIKK
jgi:large subunit ribosomal protein L24